MFDMLTELFTTYERTVELGYDFLFFIGQLVWIFWIDGREIAVLHRIFFTVDGNDATLKVYKMQQHAVVHFKFRSAADGFSFQFELDDTDCFMHLCQ